MADKDDIAAIIEKAEVCAPVAAGHAMLERGFHAYCPDAPSVPTSAAPSGRQHRLTRFPPRCAAAAGEPHLHDAGRRAAAF